MKLILSFIAGGLLAITLCLYYHDCPVITVEKIVYKEAPKPKPAPKPTRFYNTDINYYALIYSMAKAESNFRHKGYMGSAGERGIIQLRKCTWIDGCKKLKVNWAYNRVWERETSFKVAMGYVKWMEAILKKRGYKNDRLLKGLICGYNCGIFGYMKGREPRITSRYYSKVIREYNKQISNPTWRHHREGERIHRAVNWVLNRN